MNWKLGWKSIVGAVLVFLGEITKPEVLAVLSPKVAGILTGVGAFLAIFGLRSAQARTEEKVDEAATIAAVAADKDVGKTGGRR